jgi:hypothetical protein
MATSELVLIDTCLWVPFFNRPHSAEKAAVDELIDDDRVILIGPVLSEILLGFRRDEHADWVASTLRGVQFLDTLWTHWQEAARLGRRLTANGHRLPLSDLVVASVAIEQDFAVYTNDAHFDLFPDLKRYAP